jgi:hypothetical protein
VIFWRLPGDEKNSHASASEMGSVCIRVKVCELMI